MSSQMMDIDVELEPRHKLSVSEKIHARVNRIAKAKKLTHVQITNKIIPAGIKALGLK